MMTAKESIRHIVYAAYHKYRELRGKAAMPVDNPNDEKHVAAIKKKAPTLLKKLKTDVHSNAEIDSLILTAKGFYSQYAFIQSRNPKLADKELAMLLDELIWVVCAHEAEILCKLGYAADEVQKAFEQKNAIMSLGSFLVTVAAKNALSIRREPEELPPLYSTGTGARFHKEDCPFCSGRELTPTTPEKIKARGLKACKCLRDVPMVNDIIKAHYITVFLDESARPIPWRLSEEDDWSGCYSYIIADGYLLDQSELSDGNIITSGADYSSEGKRIEKITETGIGKILFMLQYDYNYAGKVLIYADNQACVHDWYKIPMNRKLTDSFESVAVKYVPRKNNSKADLLSRKKYMAVMGAREYERLGKAFRLLREIG